MKNKPIIGIVGRCYFENNKSIIKVDEDYRIAIVKSGGMPILIVPTDINKYGRKKIVDVVTLSENEKEDLIRILKLCDGILMTGGSQWYQFDEIICKYAIDNNIPILGICLGMQILANIENFCGTKSSDKTIKNNTIINHCQKEKKYVHKCIIMDGILSKIMNKKVIKVNSRHNYHIVEKNNLKIEAYSEDGIIEAISLPNSKFALGIQWHPENMINYDKIMKKIFDEFIKNTKK